VRGNAILRYNSARLFAASRTAPEQLQAISLVQDFQFGFSLERQTIKSVGYEEIMKPIVSNQRPYLSFTYFISDLDNEKLFRMPVTAEAALLDKVPIFTGLEPFDLFFLSNSENQDFKDAPESSLSACAFINASLSGYSFSLLPSGVIKVSVTFDAENVIYDTFDNISDYSYLDYDREDLEIINRNVFQINDGEEEINLGMGGHSVQGRVQSFDFSANIPRKELYDFGQHFHGREIKFPISSSISIKAFVSEQVSGRLDSILCSDRDTDFLISSSRASCDNPTWQNDKAGMAFLGAKLASQDYETSVSRGDFLTATLNFTLDIPKVFTGKAGVFISQHISKAGDVVKGEDANLINNIILENGSNAKILMEVAHDMINQLNDLRTS
jgi:hypothetical protein